MSLESDEAAKSVDRTMAHRKQGCRPFRGFPAGAAPGLPERIIGEKNTTVNRILGQGSSTKGYILTNKDPEITQHFCDQFSEYLILDSEGLCSTAALGCLLLGERAAWWSGHLWPRNGCF
jgi:hypothetical protein